MKDADCCSWQKHCSALNPFSIRQRHKIMNLQFDNTQRTQLALNPAMRCQPIKVHQNEGCLQIFGTNDYKIILLTYSLVTHYCNYYDKNLERREERKKKNSPLDSFLWTHDLQIGRPVLRPLCYYNSLSNYLTRSGLRLIKSSSYHSTQPETVIRNIFFARKKKKMRIFFCNSSC